LVVHVKLVGKNMVQTYRTRTLAFGVGEEQPL